MYINVTHFPFLDDDEAAVFFSAFRHHGHIGYTSMYTLFNSSGA